MDTKQILDFLSVLKRNNTREWFQDHKEEYESAKKEMLLLLQTLIEKIAVFDPSIGQLEAKNCLFRIYRDVRFSKNKEPYKTNMGGFFSIGGRKGGNAGYYIHLEPGNCFLGGGIYRPEASRLKAIRDEIAYTGADLKDIIENVTFKKYFSEIKGESLVRPPKDFEPEHEYIDFLKMKSFTVFHQFDDPVSRDSKIIDEIVPFYKVMMPFNSFLNKAFTS